MSARDMRPWQNQVEGTSALAPQRLSPQEQQRQEQERRQRAQQQRRQERQAALTQVYVRRGAALFLLVCTLMVGVLFLQTRVQANNIELNRLKSRLEEIQNENEALQVQIGYADDLNAAREYAATQPGMGAAQPWQVIAVPGPTAGR